MTLAAGLLKKNIQHRENFDDLVGTDSVILSNGSTHFFSALGVNNMEVLYGSSA